MRFLRKLANWLRGKGYKETIEKKEEETEKEETVLPIAGIETEPTETEETIEIEEPTEIKIPEKEEKEKKKEPTEIEKAKRIYERKPKVKDIEKKINPEGVNEIKIEEGTAGDLNLLKPQYEKIFTEGAKLNDPDILSVLFQGRKQLQHRFTGKIEVYIDGKSANGLLLIGVLIEHLQLIYSFIQVEMQIDSPTQLDELLNEAGRAIQEEYGITHYNLTGTNNMKGKITNIEIDVTFA